jgi:hypothetical protein
MARHAREAVIGWIADYDDDLSLAFDLLRRVEFLTHFREVELHVALVVPPGQRVRKIYGEALTLLGFCAEFGQEDMQLQLSNRKRRGEDFEPYDPFLEGA